MRADLHVHSTASDGTLPPARLVELAVSAGLDVLALADHDSVESHVEAAQAASDAGITLVPAVELSAVHGDLDVHILAYYVDPQSTELLGMLHELRAFRLARAREMISTLSAAGYSIHIDDVLAVAGEGSAGRSHIARALVETGHAETPSDAFERLIGRGRPFYVPKRSKSPAKVVAHVRAMGALPVLAHPAITGAGALIPALMRAGLAGVEAYHADHSAEQRIAFASLAADLKLLVTGGSDYHGPHAPNPPLGSVDIPSSAIEGFLAADPR